MSKSILWIYTRFWQWTLLTWLHWFWTRSPKFCSRLWWFGPRKVQRGFSFGYNQANSRFVWGRRNFLALDSMPSLFQYGLDGKQGCYWWKLDEDNNASTSLSCTLMKPNYLLLFILIVLVSLSMYLLCNFWNKTLKNSYKS